ncbi:MAG: NAD-dependent succinate-semialdehyde dehydrogenase [Mesorhizobium sp.]|uniref:NAD-dependent succinate-semialdehyde dehydrogenase n=1 Tax=Mesorhizobium sp. TaxID=1871066 RepID=UPI000FE4746D|nr:NAD-dependent succinate-semialdehyde dehydrogenase [Mesorhizobium sp.]RWB75897.1 MAG: NAD-dependent succinate-semialdehyde dehydrogenase [Mesorhizobium sp.]
MSGDQHQTSYPSVLLHIGGEWRAADSGRIGEVLNPATQDVIGYYAHAGILDLDLALAAAEHGFQSWKRVSAFERCRVMRRAAEILRQRCDQIATWMTIEQGKPIAEARAEVMAGADIIEWFAEEGRRSYGRVIPARVPAVRQLTVKEPVGVVVAFTPWNFPINQAVRKISAALAAGCSIVLKAPEETPAAPAELVRAFVDAGLPAGALNLVYGTPGEISNHLIASPVVRKISFTGSTAVGKQLAALAGVHMKRATMELGGHTPVVVLRDANVDAAARITAAAKFRNAGQVCVSPTRFLIEEPVYDRFVDTFHQATKSVKVGSGLEPETTMGPLANARRIEAIDGMVHDAIQSGAELVAGGQVVGNRGYFYEPTILSRVPTAARVMNEEPFGPVALMVPLPSLEAIIAEANRLNFGLASYAFTRSAAAVNRLTDEIAAGMLSVNHTGLALPEVPFGGINDSGNGTEGGADALEPYLNTKFVTHRSDA